MDYFKMAYVALGGLGLFFLGLRFLSDSLQAMAGTLIRRMINAATSNRFSAVLVGIGVTTIIQSSSITTVMVVGLVNAGLMQLSQAIGVILGANIGTTITGWILVVKVGKFGLLLLGLGIFPMLFVKNTRVAAAGKVLVSLGLIFLGLETMSGAFKPLRTNTEFIGHLALFDASTLPSVLGCVLIGCLLTFVIQSSSAMLGITIAMAATGTLSFPTAAALVLGENIGTTITALLASIGANVTAKRAALSHALFNVLGVCLLAVFFQPYIALVDSVVPGDPELLGADGSKANIAAHIAMGHTLFNVTGTLVMLPFVNKLAAIVCWLVKSKEKERHHLSYVSSHGAMVPGVSLSIASEELENLARITKNLLITTERYVTATEPDSDLYDKAAKIEGASDRIQQEITTFVCEVMQGPLSNEQSAYAYSLIRAADELESIADYAQSLCQYKQRLVNAKVDLRDESWADVNSFFAEVAAFFNDIVQRIEEPKAGDNEIVQQQAMALNRRGDQIRDNYLTRSDQHSPRPIAALTFSDMMISLRRIKNHAINLFEAMQFGTDDNPQAIESTR